MKINFDHQILDAPENLNNHFAIQNASAAADSSDSDIDIEIVNLIQAAVNVNKQIIEKYTQTYGIDGADDYINIEIDPDFNYVDIQ